jgi:hypothetical protein
MNSSLSSSSSSSSSSLAYASYSIIFRATSPGLIFQSRVHNQLVVFGFARQAAKASAELGSSPIRIGDVLSGVNDISLLDGDGMKVEDQLAILAAAEAFSNRDTCLHFLRPMLMPRTLSTKRERDSGQAISADDDTDEILDVDIAHYALDEKVNVQEANEISIVDAAVDLSMAPTSMKDSLTDAQDRVNDSGSSVRMKWISQIAQDKFREIVNQGLVDSGISRVVLAKSVLHVQASNLRAWLKGQISLHPHSVMISLLFRWLARGCPISDHGFGSPTSTLPDQSPTFELDANSTPRRVVGVGLPSDVWSWVIGGRPALEASWSRDEITTEITTFNNADHNELSVYDSDSKPQLPIYDLQKNEPRRPERLHICCWLGLWETSRVHADRGDGKRDGPICVRRVLGPRGDIRSIEKFLMDETEQDKDRNGQMNQPRGRLLPPTPRQRPPRLGGILLVPFGADQTESHVLGHHKSDGVMRIGSSYQANLPNIQPTEFEPKDTLLWSASAFLPKRSGITQSIISQSVQLKTNEESLSTSLGVFSTVAGAEFEKNKGQGVSKNISRANRRSAGPVHAISRDLESGIVSLSSLVAAASTPLPGATRLQYFFSLGRLPVPTVEYGDDVFSLTVLQYCGFSFSRASDLLSSILNTVAAEAEKFNEVDTSPLKRKNLSTSTESVPIVVQPRKRGPRPVAKESISFPEIPPPNPLFFERGLTVFANVAGVNTSILLHPGTRLYSKREYAKILSDLISINDSPDATENAATIVENESTEQSINDDTVAVVEKNESTEHNRPDVPTAVEKKSTEPNRITEPSQLQYSMLPDHIKPCPKNVTEAIGWGLCIRLSELKVSAMDIAPTLKILKSKNIQNFLSGEATLGPITGEILLVWLKKTLHPSIFSEIIDSVKAWTPEEMDEDIKFAKTLAIAIEANPATSINDDDSAPESTEIQTATQTFPPLLSDALHHAFVDTCGRFSWNVLDRQLFELSADLYGKRIGKLCQGIADLRHVIEKSYSSTSDSSINDHLPVNTSSSLTIQSACRVSMGVSQAPSIPDCVAFFYQPRIGQGQGNAQAEFRTWRKRLNYNPIPRTSVAVNMTPLEVSLGELLEREAKGDASMYVYNTSFLSIEVKSSKKKGTLGTDDSSGSEGTSAIGGLTERKRHSGKFDLVTSIQKLAARINAEFVPLIFRLEEMIQKGNKEAEDSEDEDEDFRRPVRAAVESDGAGQQENDGEAADESVGQATDQVTASTFIGPEIEMNVEDRFFGVHSEECAVCDYGGNIVSCASCERQFHFPCIGRTQPLAFPPEGLGLWTCPVCEQRYANDPDGLRAARLRIQLELEIDLAKKRFAFCRRRAFRADHVRRVTEKILTRIPLFPSEVIKKFLYEWACTRDPEEMSLNTRVGCPRLRNTF